MAMFNPPHPGEFITEVYLEPHGISGRELAEKLDVAASTLSRIWLASTSTCNGLASSSWRPRPDIAFKPKRDSFGSGFAARFMSYRVARRQTA